MTTIAWTDIEGRPKGFLEEMQELIDKAKNEEFLLSQITDIRNLLSNYGEWGELDVGRVKRLAEQVRRERDTAETTKEKLLKENRRLRRQLKKFNQPPK